MRVFEKLINQKLDESNNENFVKSNIVESLENMLDIILKNSIKKIGIHYDSYMFSIKFVDVFLVNENNFDMIIELKKEIKNISYIDGISTKNLQKML
jgi:hypothetical protein